MSTRTVPPTPPPRPVHTLSEPLLPMFSITSTKRTPNNNGYSNQLIQHSEHEDVKVYIWGLSCKDVEWFIVDHMKDTLYLQNRPVKFHVFLLKIPFHPILITTYLFV